MSTDDIVDPDAGIAAGIKPKQVSNRGGYAPAHDGRDVRSHGHS